MDNFPHAKHGISEPFEVVYRKLKLPLTKFLHTRMRGDQHGVEEVFSRTMAAAWEGWHNFRHKSSYFTWICRIGLNKVADYYRGQVNDNSRWVAPFIEELASGDANELTPLERLSLAELRVSFRECLNLLPSRMRELLQFRYWHDLTLREIAKKLGTSERAIEGQLYRAKKVLKQVLAEKHPELTGVEEKK